jgi:hypothetical protein
MDDIDTELAFILASCKNKGQLDYQIARYAKIVQQLGTRSRIDVVTAHAEVLPLGL